MPQRFGICALYVLGHVTVLATIIRDDEKGVFVGFELEKLLDVANNAFERNSASMGTVFSYIQQRRMNLEVVFQRKST